MKFFKKLAPAVALALCFGIGGCGDTSFSVKLGYNDGTLPNEDGTLFYREYDESLFYRNDLTLKKVADPSVIYVEEGEYAGKLFLYGTSNTLSVRGIGVWQSDDGVHWDSYGVAFEPETASWGYSSLWAPEVIYDGAGKYYMTYSARNSNTIAAGGKYYGNTYIGLAVSDSPAGPFVQWTGTNADGAEIGLGDPIFDPAKITAVDGVACEAGHYARYRFLDSSLFADGDELYMYFSRGKDRYNVLTPGDDYAYGKETSEIWGVKMKDFSTPDYSTVTRLTKVGYNTVDGETEADYNDIDRERASADQINEAPQMYKRDGVYYLTYSVGGTTSNFYSVAQALGSSPLGPFTKLNKADGGLVLGTEMNWIQAAGTGHHSFTPIGDELFIFHHEGADRYTIDSENRAIAYDRAGMAENSKGQKVLAANGPTSYSLQPLPAAISGYKNIAPEAEVSVSGLKEGSDKKWLTDGFFASHLTGVVGETEFDAGATAEISLRWKEYRTVGALLLYNSIDYDKTFYRIARISLSVRTASGATGTAVADNAAFPFDETTNYSSQQLMFAGSNLVLDFNDIEVNGITITFRAPRSEGSVAVGDICVLGK